ncbi:hypothetical protein M407DRAFT_33994 [Tulasnella calospora MUT 4182]|uniref:Protein kinase domain-containing protein n=1 Tax=Tulasnella calospora MUT 4182 TaxID=1051891 RepID=A0A0C3L419_9AGAM|nr:hypothetical protein M407DRAFT_33994 [Tulasnella calospora MUT 4182]
MEGDADTDIPIGLGSNSSVSSGGFEPSARIRARVEKLAHERIDPMLITFWDGACESHGGHATVLKARMYMRRWRRTDVVAVKKTRIADDMDLERALGLAIREAEFLAGFSHPNIIKFEGFIEELSKGIIWLVFPWADNGNLKDFVALKDWVTFERISLINDVAQGLAYLHSREPRICHGDLKSLNVLVNSECRAAITDFGSARPLRRRVPRARNKRVDNQPWPAQPPNATFHASTNTITLTGNKYTIRWAAPEVLIEDRLSLESDIWALGWIAYEVMTNFLPFEDASSDVVVVERVLGGQLPSLSENDHLSVIHELCSLMTLCWQANPTKRPKADYCRDSIEQMPMVVPEFNPSLSPGVVAKRSHSTELLRKFGYMYQSRGEYAKAFDAFVKQLEHSRSFGKAKDEVSSLQDLAQLHQLLNEDDKAIRLYCEALEIRPDLSDRTGRALALWGLADVHRLRGEYDKAIRLYSEALKIPNLHDGKVRANALWGLAHVHRLRSEYDKAISHYSEALEICTNLDDRAGRADSLWGLADVHGLRDEYDQAISLYSEALKIRTDLRDRKGRADALWGLADIHRLRSESDKAIRLYSEAFEIHTDRDDRRGEANALWGLAGVHRLREEYDKAVRLYSEALEIHTDLSDGKGRADALCGLAGVHQDRGEYDDAIPLYSEALEIRIDLSDRKGRADALLGLADVHGLRGDSEKSIRLYSQASKILTKIGDGKGKADALLGLAHVHRLRGEYKPAIRLYSEALKIRTDLGDEKGRADGLLGLADVHRHRGERDQAILLYSKALKICTDVRDRRGKADALSALADLQRYRVRQGHPALLRDPENSHRPQQKKRQSRRPAGSR